MSNGKIVVYDTTLRDGEQREDLSPSTEDKLRITDALDEIGVDYIEGGWPGSNPKDSDYFEKLEGRKLKNSKTVSFGSTRRKGIRPEEDGGLKLLLDSGTDTICIYGKTWDDQVIKALQTTLNDNLDIIGSSVSYLKEHGVEVIYDAEHFFDGYKANPRYAIQTLKAAESNGASWIVLCDTNGRAMPDEIYEVVSKVKTEIKIPLGIHAHNDSECAVANSIMAVKAGCSMVQGTINGYGERCGNANLCSVIPNLQLKNNFDVLSADSLQNLKELSYFVSEILNLTHFDYQPYVGHSAFTHKGGMHIDAIKKGAIYEHIDPALVGNSRRIVVSQLAGRKTIMIKAKELGIDLENNEELARDILSEVERLENKGYQFQAADGSLFLLILKKLKQYKPLFDFRKYEVNIVRDFDSGNAVYTKASIKGEVFGELITKEGLGDGPVNALDEAFKQLLNGSYHELNNISLSDFKVRVINPSESTAAKVRVLIESTDGMNEWGTIGVHENIVEASFRALIDAYEYGLLLQKQQQSK